MILLTGNTLSRLKAKKNLSAFQPSSFPAIIGFTLVEMLVVLAIVVMLLGISIPFTAGFGKGLRLKTSARAILGTLRVARSNAITFRKEYKVVFDVANNQYWIEDAEGRVFERKRTLTGSIKFEIPEDLDKDKDKTEGEEKPDPITFEDDKVIFLPSGSIAGTSGSITLQDKQGTSRTISIIGSTGKITID